MEITVNINMPDVKFLAEAISGYDGEKKGEKK